MNSLLPALACLLLAAPATAQCPPPLLNCSANPPVFCAQAGNDPLFWNQSYWWDPVHEQHDLAEAGIPLNLSALSTCPDATTIRYTLYLDLDADERLQPLELWFAPQQTDTSFARVFHPQPNPTAGESVLPVWLPADAQIALRLFDPAGRLAYTLTQTLPAGVHRLSIPADALLSTGVYSWQMIVGDHHYSGKLVRL